jgi:hypothetical protein
MIVYGGVNADAGAAELKVVSTTVVYVQVLAEMITKTK